jgi:hypothetical protein
MSRIHGVEVFEQCKQQNQVIVDEITAPSIGERDVLYVYRKYR